MLSIRWSVTDNNIIIFRMHEVPRQSLLYNAINMKLDGGLGTKQVLI